MLSNKIRYLSKIEADKLMRENTIKELILIGAEVEYSKKIRQDLKAIDAQVRHRYFGHIGKDTDNITDKKTYDLIFGLELYEYLEKELSLDLRDASNADFWIYLSVLVIPDIIEFRWDAKSFGRYYMTNNRIYLFTLWWYVHLSWQGSYQETYNVLKDNTTDEILQLVDRTGGLGYRIDLYRRIMLEFSKVKKENRVRKGEYSFFRKILILNTTLIKTTEPSLLKGGIEEYVSLLFNGIGLYKNGEQYEYRKR